MTPKAPWSLVYADGSANVYRFEATLTGVRFAYEPVTPERSNTGTYSGGNPVDERLVATDPRLARLWEYAQALEGDTANHADERNKGDGAFTVTTGGNRRRFLVVRAATRALEGFLVKEFRGVED